MSKKHTYIVELTYNEALEFSMLSDCGLAKGVVYVVAAALDDADPTLVAAQYEAWENGECPDDEASIRLVCEAV